jgi:predicted PurR-regulated permease PerM
MTLSTSLQKVAYSVVIMIGVGWILYIGRSLIQPLVFAIIFSILLFPIEKLIRLRVKIEWLSIIFTFLVVISPVLVLGALLSMQLINIMDTLPSITEKLRLGAVQLEHYIQNLLPLFGTGKTLLISDPIDVMLDNLLDYLSEGIISTTTIVANFFLIFTYMFFMLYYRKSFKNFIIFQFRTSNRADIREVIGIIEDTIQSYLGGLFLVIVLLSIVNSIGLKIIGIEYAMFWGVLAGILAIIPYIGTAIGGMLPLFYALSTTDSFWQPAAIVLFYSFIQFLEGNLITPKIVGDKINVNPLFAIFSLIFFGNFWGLGGVILALPLISIIRIILSHFDNTRPLAVLMSSAIAEGSDQFRTMSKK